MEPWKFYPAFKLRMKLMKESYIVSITREKSFGPIIPDDRFSLEANHIPRLSVFMV